MVSPTRNFRFFGVIDNRHALSHKTVVIVCVYQHHKLHCRELRLPFRTSRMLTGLAQVRQTSTTTMESFKYRIPSGVHAIPRSDLDLRPDAEIDALLLHPAPVPERHEKNIWLFWHSGYVTMHPYTKRTVRAYHRRFARKGWTVRVLDLAAASPGNVKHFVNVSNPTLFPRAFREGNITGRYALQHMSDLVRWPLLLRYGGVYADVGLMQIGDLDQLWNETVGNPDPHPVTGKRYEVLAYHMNGEDTDDHSGRYNLTNYFLCSRPNNPLFLRCHRLFLALWDEGGGKSSTEGMHLSPLLEGVDLLGKSLSPDVQVALSDYIIQGQALRLVMGSVDSEDGWDGPKYITEHLYGMDYMIGSQLINEKTAWSGARAFELMSLRLPEEREVENTEQKAAREIVEECLSKSFAFKLAHGLILAVYGDTLGSLWRKHEGSDDIPGTYAHWLRYGMIHWVPDELPCPTKFELITPYKNGRLLEAA